ncbi:MAG: hypothetical protein ACRDD7_16965 [Peptostreptococcaceae bacterium]
MNYLNELEKLVGGEFNVDEIICCFTDTEEEIIVSKVEGVRNSFEGYGACQCYNIYENTAAAEIYTMYVSEDNEIVSVS